MLVEQLVNLLRDRGWTLSERKDRSKEKVLVLKHKSNPEKLVVIAGGLEDLMGPMAVQSVLRQADISSEALNRD